MKYRGPGFSQILLSSALVGGTAAPWSRDFTSAWDELCDEVAGLADWYETEALLSGTDISWTIDDNVGAPRRRRGHGRLGFRLDIREFQGPDALDRFKELIMWSLTLRAELEGTQPPPQWRPRTGDVPG